AVVRMINGTESSKWFEEQVRKIYKKEHLGSMAIINSAIIRAVRNIQFENGGYSLCMREFDEILSKWVLANSMPIDKSVVYMITDALIKYPAIQFDSIMANWADPSDREYCQKIADVLIDHAVSGKFGSPITLSYLRNLGVINVKGLAEKYFRNNPKPKDGRWSLQGFFNVLQGDNDYKLAEAREIVELLKSGKLKMKLTDEDIQLFSDWAEERFK
ncbi:MAG: hypothetical protein K2N56_07655, partial [Oscillospiraceae bacterium]|nr:hypothetical protein [Oscillospiraceae bacterium]